MRKTGIMAEGDNDSHLSMIQPDVRSKTRCHDQMVDYTFSYIHNVFFNVNLSISISSPPDCRLPANPITADPTLSYFPDVFLYNQQYLRAAKKRSILPGSPYHKNSTFHTTFDQMIS